MPKDSLKNLLKSFPYFLNKEVTSNFYKAQYVNNRIFQKVYQSLFEVYESFHLEKRCLIWKTQSEPYHYFINFVVNCPHLKTVQCYKNDVLIYVEEYRYEDNVGSFLYCYDSSEESEGISYIFNEIDEQIENNLLESNEDITEEVTPIIPEDTFMIIAETYDETILQKGFPENDEILGNVFDHDVSLDEFGAQNNIPRKQYIPVNESDYARTEPPYNNRLSEDDFHYMNRIIEYNLKLYDVPLPVLEIWKLYGLDAVMLNRERLLFKWFDENKHPRNDKTGHVLEWIPEKWEHKDGFYNYNDKLGTYFFVIPSTNTPKKWTDVTFKFKLLNNLAEELDTKFTVNIYKNKNQNPIISNWDKSEYTVSSDLLDELEVNSFRFVAFSNNEQIGDETIDITVKGCNNGDLYVSSQGSDENGDGTKDNPYFTLDKAMENITDNRNIVVVQGDINLTNPTFINNSCTLLGCGNAVIHNDITNKFFKIIGNKNITLTLLDLSLNSNGAVSYVKSTKYTNQNKDYQNYLTVLVHGGTPLLTIELDKESYYYQYDNVQITGTLKSKECNPIKNANLKIMIDDEIIKTITTDNEGEFSDIITIENYSPGEYDLRIIFEGSSTFDDNENIISLDLTKNPETVTIPYGDSLSLTSEGHASGDEVEFYVNGEYYDTVIANASGNAILSDYSPAYGVNTVYSTVDGDSIINEWIIETTFKLSDLSNDYFITDLIVRDDDVYCEKTATSNFSCIRELTDVIVDVYVDDEEIMISRFESAYSSSEVLDSDNIYPLDFERINQALIDVSMSEGSLYCTRGGGGLIIPKK